MKKIISRERIEMSKNVLFAIIALFSCLAILGCGETYENSEPLTAVSVNNGIATAGAKIAVLEAEGPDFKTYLFPVLNPSDKLLAAMKSIKKGDKIYIKYRVGLGLLEQGYQLSILELITPTTRYP